nr:ABC transporter substrate-binding protein [Desulfobacterales bacterium]
MKRERLLSVGLLLVLVAGALAGLAPAAADARNIKVGIVDTYSGPPAVFGNDALNGFKMAVEEINQKGVLGGKIEYVTRDDKFKVDIGLNMAKELVLKENVDLIVGTVNSG